MMERIRTLIYSIALKVRFPGIVTKGHQTIRIGTEIIIKEDGSLYIGNQVRTQRHVTFGVVGGKMTIGDYVSFNRNNIIVCHEEIQIGNHCAFGPNVVIYDHDHKFGPIGIATNDFNTSPIIIEDNCWIGANTIILRGAHIGEGCVIGAGSTIQGNIPPHTLVTCDRELIFHPIVDRKKTDKNTERE